MTLKLLLIDDDRDLRILVKELLEIYFDMEVVESSSCIEATRLFYSELFQMVVSDYRIHACSAQSFLHQLPSIRTKHAPVILYTGDQEVPLTASERLRIVLKPHFEKLLDEIRRFRIFPERPSQP